MFAAACTGVAEGRHGGGPGEPLLTRGPWRSGWWGGSVALCAYTVACILGGMAKAKRPREPWTAERIAALRAELGLTQAALAAELGVRQQTISEWETGQYEPRGASVRMLGLLAEGRSAYDAGGEPAP